MTNQTERSRKAMTSFIVDRSTWRCGGTGRNMRGLGRTRLKNAQGFLCCLGQISEQLGSPEEQLLDYCEPGSASEMRHKSNNENTVLYSDGSLSTFAVQAMALNDDLNHSDTARERKLSALAERKGLRIDFVGEYRKPSREDRKSTHAQEYPGPDHDFKAS